ncbi:MFS general substrate transporter [Aureobasidium sp. EXF-3400]|nr:MFS general substrate transporter [Aureobasidium sp. EXF-12344]KAI4772813.1 MFS general substrate transporter [Aureobasidium sp. EXF-3400]
MGITGDEVHELENTDDLKQATEHTEELVIARLTEEDVHKLSRESLTLKSRTGWRLAMILFVQGCNQAGYGVDWAVIGGINALPALHAYFGFGYSGSTIGVINALMTIGTVCGAPFLGLADVIGRRGVNFAGNVVVVFAALLQAWARNTEMFMAGRFFMGFGTALMSSSQYMAEISPIHLRGRLVGVFGACFQIGSLGMTGAMIGLTTLEGNYSWRIPLLLQAGLALVVCVTIYLLTPESPRYLVNVGKRDAAKHVVAKYHTTSGNLDEPLVNVVISQIDESLENEKSLAGAWWDYRIFFAKAVRFRIFDSSRHQEAYGATWNVIVGNQLGSTAIYFVFTLFGSYIIDKFRRRSLIFAGLISIIILQTATTITSWQYSVNPTHAAAGLTILWVYTFQVCSATFIATMHNLYPVEILSLALRARGMGIYSFIQGAAGSVQNYGIAVGIDKLGYKIWAVYVAYNTLQLIASYFVFPETYGLSLEEIDVVFETPGANPVKISLDIQKAKKQRAVLEEEVDGLEGKL